LRTYPNVKTPPSPANNRKPRATPRGTTADDADEDGDDPFLFRATTVQEYVFAFVTPVNVMGDVVPFALRGAPPLLEVHEAVYPVIPDPPFAGAANERLMRASPARAVGVAGRFGTVLGTIAAESVDDGPAPAALVARTEQ
jgi:hypothetical protein